MPKLRISGALQYLLWFLGRNERNKCGVCLNEHTWLEIWEKKEKWIVQKDQVKKKIEKKNGLEQKQKEKKNEEKKEVEVQFELYCKVSGIGIIWEEKLCSTSL